MLSRRAEAHDRKDPAQGRAVQIPSHSQDEHGGKQAVDPHVEQHRRSAFFKQVIGSADPPAFQDPDIGGEHILFPKHQAAHHHTPEQHDQKPQKQAVIPCGPDKPCLCLYPKGL